MHVKLKTNIFDYARLMFFWDITLFFQMSDIAYSLQNIGNSNGLVYISKTISFRRDNNWVSSLYWSPSKVGKRWSGRP